MATTPTYSEWLRSIARNIERYGHFQNWLQDVDVFGLPTIRHSMDAMYFNNNRQGLCCVIANPTNASLSRQTLSTLRNVYLGRLANDLDCGRGGVTDWNDKTPTVEVLATLRSLADENEESPRPLVPYNF